MSGVIRFGVLVCCVVFCGAGSAFAAQTYGWVERASIEPWGAVIKAKLDTGALTSSMHAREIEKFERDGEDWVRFEVDVKDERTGDVVSRTFERGVHRSVNIRGAGGRDERYVVKMKICVGDRLLEEQFSLRDRSKMIYPVLLGRRTLASLGPVDALETFLHDPECAAAG